MTSKDEEDNQNNKDGHFESTVSSRVLDIMRQEGRKKAKELEKPKAKLDNNTGPKRFPFSRRKR